MTPSTVALHDPIIAVATAPGRGAVGIVRVSSPRDLGPLIEVLGGGVALEARRARLLTLHAHDGAPIDQVLALHFPAPASATGEHVLELQGHGGPMVLQLIVQRCLELAAAAAPDGPPRLPRLRLARAGEFTERAFLNGRLDLAQAEAVADLIDADTAAAARGAARSLGGEFSREVQALAAGFESLRMLVEATLDFPEEDIDFLQAADARGQLQALHTRLQAVRHQARQGALLREGLRVVLAGVPNAGKSSLLNALAGEELAIVTPIAGTTRDRIRQSLSIDGVPLHVVDTAGLRDTDDEVERLGVARSWQAIAEADVVLWLHDLSRAHDPQVLAQERAIGAGLAAQAVGPTTAGGARAVLHAFNKVDLLEGAGEGAGEVAHGAAARDAALASLAATFAADLRGRPVPADRASALVLSLATGEGLGALRAALLAQAGWQSSPEGVYLARTRHLQALAQADQHLQAARAVLEEASPALDLLAEDLRGAHRALGEITGEFSTEDLLGAIFSRFCIGK